MYTNTHLGPSCFSGVRARPLVGALGVGAAGLALRSQLSPQKVQFFHPLPGLVSPPHRPLWKAETAS